MELVQSRIVADDVPRLAAFYARLVQADVVLNDFYVEVPTRAMSVGLSRRHFTEYREDQAACPESPRHEAQVVLDFQAGDVDAEYHRIAGLGVDWVTRRPRQCASAVEARSRCQPTTQCDRKGAVR